MSHVWIQPGSLVSYVRHGFVHSKREIGLVIERVELKNRYDFTNFKILRPNGSIVTLWAEGLEVIQ